jgi:hypothetical protein
MHAVFRYPQESRSTHIKGGAFYLYLVFFFFFFKSRVKTIQDSSFETI